jgi:hypothetical protein
LTARRGAALYHGSLIATHGIESWYRAPPPASPARIPDPVDRGRVAVGGIWYYAFRMLAYEVFTFLRTCCTDADPIRSFNASPMTQ